MKKILSLLALMLVATMLLAACGGAANTANNTANNTGNADTGDGAMEASQVEVFSWWTGGGEAAGLEAMVEVFNAEYSDIEFVNAAVAGGAGTNARAVLATRLQAGDPPDTWQGHAGQELIGTYVAGGQIEPLNDLYDAEGWLDVMPETLIPLAPASMVVSIERFIVRRKLARFCNCSAMSSATS